MHRFFLTDTPIVPDRLVDLAPIVHQVRNVLRLGPGERILLLDDSGYAYPTEIRRLERGEAAGYVLGRERVESEPALVVTLYQCALKGNTFEWVLQKATEIGVSTIVPVVSSRTIVRPAAKLRRRYDRWRVILREAAEQSGRGRLPALADPHTWEEALAGREGVGLMPWEEVRDSGASSLLSALAGPGGLSHLSLLVGPEGGISADEARQAVAAGWTPVSLGPRVLRAETAALVATTLAIHGVGPADPGRV